VQTNFSFSYVLPVPVSSMALSLNKQILVFTCYLLQTAFFIISHFCIAVVWVGRSVVSVCLFVRTLTGKRLELSAPNLVHVYSIAVAWHELTQRSKVEIIRYENRNGCMTTSEHNRYCIIPICRYATCGRCWRGSAC